MNFVHHSVDHFLALYVGVAWGTSLADCSGRKVHKIDLYDGMHATI